MGKTKSKIIPKHFALIGKNLGHSFSKSFFLEKFEKLKLHQHTYSNFEFKDESGLALFLLDDVYKLDGFNITIPYKETIIPYLDKLDKTASEIKAVNTVLIKNHKLIGFNTDVYGFKMSLKPMLKDVHKSALILGTGGASKAVAFALTLLGIKVQYVSRSPKNKESLSYEDLNQALFETNTIIINCTPVGMFPDVNECLDIPYQYLNQAHIVYDLVYNPIESLFLKKAKSKGALISNGLAMLQFQAERAWDIWNT